MNRKRQPGRPIRILFQEVRDATVRKAQARSADATSGGGARDIRLRPHDEVQPFMERMFSRERTKVRRSQGGGQEERITILLGTATWGDGRDTVELEYWPPTNARPGEGRIAKISSLPSLASPPVDAEGAVILFVQDDTGLIWVRYSTAEGLDESVPEVGDFISDCLARSRPGLIASGYIDFTDGGLGNWCRGDYQGDDV